MEYLATVAAAVLLALVFGALCDIASSLHAIARHMGASRGTTRAFGVPSDTRRPEVTGGQ